MERDAWNEKTDLYNHTSQHEGVEVEDSLIKDEDRNENVQTVRNILAQKLQRISRLQKYSDGVNPEDDEVLRTPDCISGCCEIGLDCFFGNISHLQRNMSNPNPEATL